MFGRTSRIPIKESSSYGKMLCRPSASIRGPPIPEKRIPGRASFRDFMSCAPRKSPEASPAIRYICASRIFKLQVFRQTDNEKPVGVCNLPDRLGIQ